MQKPKKERDFLDLPKLLGGKKAFREFIAKNLRYPKEALKNRIEGDVLISFEVNDLGKVTSAKVINGPGYGCDEEALRLIHLIPFSKTRKQGVRVKSTFRTKIRFELPAQTSLSYQYKAKEKTAEKPKKQGISYTYTIKKQQS